MPRERVEEAHPSQDHAETPAARLLAGPLRVINVGLAGFAHDLAASGSVVQHVAWTPPANGDPVLAALLAKLEA